MHIIVHCAQGGAEQFISHQPPSTRNHAGCPLGHRRGLLFFRPADGRSLAREGFCYFTRFIMLNIGRYIEMTMRPTRPPMNSIIIGSMIDVSDLTVASTSVS